METYTLVLYDGNAYKYIKGSSEETLDIETVEEILDEEDIVTLGGLSYDEDSGWTMSNFSFITSAEIALQTIGATTITVSEDTDNYLNAQCAMKLDDGIIIVGGGTLTASASGTGLEEGETNCGIYFEGNGTITGNVTVNATAYAGYGISAEGISFDEEDDFFLNVRGTATVFATAVWADENSTGTGVEYVIGFQGDLRVFESATVTAKCEFDDTPASYNKGNVKAYYSNIEQPVASATGYYEDVDWDPDEQSYVYVNDKEGLAQYVALEATSDFTSIKDVAVNTTWTAGKEPVIGFKVEGAYYYYGVNAFNNNAAALALSGLEKLTFADGSYDSTLQGNATNVRILAGTYEGKVLGSTIVSEASELDGDISLTIKGGTFTQAVACGNGVSTGVDVTRKGNLNLSISGGTFDGLVAGGMFYCPSNSSDTAGSAKLSGNVNFTITGGTFNGRIFGGNIARTDTLGENTRITGAVNLTINATTAIAINENIVAGSMGAGTISKSVTVTFTGNGKNLTFGDSSVVFGGSNSDTARIEVDGLSEKKTISSTVGKNSAYSARKLVFDNFKGDFGAEIKMFGSAEFKGNSNVKFTDTDLDLWAVESWTFQAGSTVSGLQKNNFKGDTLVFDMTDYDENSWTVLKGTEAAFEGYNNISEVTFGGGTVTKNGSSWSDGNYTMTIEHDEDEWSMTVTKIATKNA